MMSPDARAELEAALAALDYDALDTLLHAIVDAAPADGPPSGPEAQEAFASRVRTILLEHISGQV